VYGHETLLQSPWIRQKDASVLLPTVGIKKYRVAQKLAKSSISSAHHIDATAQAKNEMIFTNMFREFTRLKFLMQFCAMVKYSV